MAYHNQQFQGKVEKESQGVLSLSQQINAATREGHDIVNIMIMRRLSIGLRDYKLYREGILSFAHVYKAFEDAWMAAIAPGATTDVRIKHALQNLYSVPLLRTPQLIKDLEYFSEQKTYNLDMPKWPTGVGYVAHIKRVIAEKPHLVIAYAHNYYMALFAGGKILKYQISQAKGFFPQREKMTGEECEAAGTNLFSFEVPKGKEDMLRSGFKDALVDIQSTLTPEERTDIIEESKAIFKNNEQLILELDRICATMMPPPRPPPFQAEPRVFTLRDTGEMAFIRTYKFEILFVSVFCYAAVRLFFF
ncbi:heme oxygenase-like protein [Choiromyces venosus 120613-1]|uniref:Heme oxygenase-like protein n=1 Tax=Choiromyces venosus 120613-1 TaxID=1336337 RepID=A0A3N4J977_9PEZI|nr:heme oxygenase-like protein [Choiromyces venosus 120613-1]